MDNKPEVILTNWRLERMPGGYCALMGMSPNHPTMLPGIELRTSMVLKINFVTGIAETMNTNYKLEGLGG